MSLVIDASVWVAAADARDPLSPQSRAFLTMVTGRALSVTLPAVARLEVACALARRWRDAQAGRRLADALLAGPTIRERPVDAGLVAKAVELGTEAFLRGADALYAAVARSEDAELVAWDADLVARAGARTPSEWLSGSS
jgi:predicted nucleic acid-binding protein